MDFRFFPLTPKGTADAGIRALARIAGTREEDGSVWIQCAYEGSWQGHGAGAFELTPGIFEQVVANFERREDDVPVIHGHPGVGSDAAAHMGAAGWISALKIGEDDKGRVALFARTKWTDRSASKIAADEYRYCSVVLAFDSVDEVTGEEIGAELLELGIVPAAFLDGMSRLAASRAGRKQNRALAQDKDSTLELNEIIKRAQKELPEGFTRDQLVAFIDAEEQKARAIEGGESAPADEEPAEEVAASAAPDEDAAVVEASDAPVVAVGEGEDGAEAALAAEGMIVDFAHALASEMSVDLPALLASFEENRDAVMAALGAAPEEGTSADADMAEMSASHSGAVVSLAKAEAKTVELSKRVADLEHKNELAAFEVELSRHCVATEILDQTRIELMKTATDPDYGDKALTVARKQLAAALDKGTGVPTELSYKPKSAKETVNAMGDISSDEAIKLAEEELKEESAKTGVSLSRKDLRSKTYSLAKAKFPAAFGITIK